MKLHKPEWSFPVEIEHIQVTPAVYHIIADKKACEALADRFDLIDIKMLEADITMTRERSGLVIHLEGSIRGDVTQECVVTLGRVENHVEDKFEAFFSDSRQAVSFVRAKAEKKAKEGEREIEMIDERDAPEPVRDGVIDIAELSAQYFSLALDPYPRSKEAPAAVEVLEDPNKFEKTQPFAALKDWKDKLK
jgi:hypothetical protein